MAYARDILEYNVHNAVTRTIPLDYVLRAARNGVVLVVNYALQCYANRMPEHREHVGGNQYMSFCDLLARVLDEADEVVVEYLVLSYRLTHDMGLKVVSRCHGNKDIVRRLIGDSVYPKYLFRELCRTGNVETRDYIINHVEMSQSCIDAGV